jgi:pre-mRNA-splicing factor SYF2
VIPKARSSWRALTSTEQVPSMKATFYRILTLTSLCGQTQSSLLERYASLSHAKRLRPPKLHKIMSDKEQSPPPAGDGVDQTPESSSASLALVESGAESSSGNSSDRMARFKALQARQAQSRKENLKASTAEAQKMATDPELLAKLQRKHAIASHKLLKAETADAGEDFERKRAWDWTVDESQKWDKRMDKKAKHREDVAFQDYRQDARKVYKRQMRELKPNVEAYEREKVEAVEKAARSGGLEIVENEDGELVAVDKDGTFYSTADSTDFIQNKPGKEAIDRLVNDLRKAEEVRLKKRRDRGLDDDTSGDVTYINQKNKQFNEKLARFYNKYTADIRESFERGTAL